MFESEYKCCLPEWRRRKTSKAFLVDVDFKRVKTCDQHIQPEIKLQTYMFQKKISKTCDILFLNDIHCKI